MNNSKFKLGQEVYAMDANRPVKLYVGAILECDENMFLYRLSHSEQPISYINARESKKHQYTFESKVFASSEELKDSLFNRALA